MARFPRAFICPPEGPVQPVDKLKFAVVDDRERIVSAVWTVFPAHNPVKPDIYVTASGAQGKIKYSFHGDVLHRSIVAEAHAGLVERGLVPPGSRHHQQLPIATLPWHGLTLRLVPEMLSKTGHSAEDFDGTIVALPVPRPGLVLEVGFILAEGTELNVRGAQAILGQVVGAGRALVVVLAFREQNGAAQKVEYQELLNRVPVSDAMIESVEPDADLAMFLYGEEGGIMTVTEVHNVRVVRAEESST